jgi:hypothetical protein
MTAERERTCRSLQCIGGQPNRCRVNLKIGADREVGVENTDWRILLWSSRTRTDEIKPYELRTARHPSYNRSSKMLQSRDPASCSRFFKLFRILVLVNNGNRCRVSGWNEAAVDAIKLRNDLFLAAWAIHNLSPYNLF